MEQVNTLRVVLVAGAALATVVAAIVGQWTVVAVLATGIVGHAVLWAYLRRSDERSGDRS